MDILSKEEAKFDQEDQNNLAKIQEQFVSLKPVERGFRDAQKRVKLVQQASANIGMTANLKESIQVNEGMIASLSERLEELLNLQIFKKIASRSAPSSN